jgi:hypothetical protein
VKAPNSQLQVPENNQVQNAKIRGARVPIFVLGIWDFPGSLKAGKLTSFSLAASSHVFSGLKQSVNTVIFGTTSLPEY